MPNSDSQTVTSRTHRRTDSACLVRTLRAGDRVRYPDGHEAVVLWTHKLEHGNAGWLITHLDAPDRVVPAGTIVHRLTERRPDAQRPPRR